ncbi:YitT family protein [Ureaplasma urealyticum]|uniref:YitT family protein n=2 Tax=Ureaplasma urealyticum TaxID=2130 RepID=A0AAP9D7T1_UREUR|nr:YitT family protein [Ureaplasma urealyticum]EDX53589.1 putative membrane protein [Ureaplasma urealyticum serovar 9 str. ATCC 33175]EDU06031.1 putative membrane protein [Ureaplasma urealyticum serovar 5 str. ATCC 27817]EDU56673.1 putative membrane protein [Ureaplasma urealyticum serovar 7 str. ATCC 27819]EDU67312.1 putative membrane protein [Ureaplasma urealyticum serovar 11 str. ATCC 33695]EDX53246.1 putative membrane protein [Ureaplasma urealyticum serovar 12 str. ATCC 33696]
MNNNEEKTHPKNRIKKIFNWRNKTKEALRTENNLLKQISNEATIQQSVQIEKIRYKAGLLKFAALYSTKKIFLRYLIIVIFSLLASLLVLLLVHNTGIYSAGIMGTSQGIARILQSIMISNHSSPKEAKLAYDIMFWLFAIFVNIPLLVFSYKKIGKHFTLMTLTYIVTVQVFGFALSQIPNVEKIMIFGDNRLSYPPINSFFTNSILDEKIAQNIEANVLSYANISNLEIRNEFINYVQANPNATIGDLFHLNQTTAYRQALYEFAKPLYVFHDLIVNKVQILSWVDPDQASKIPSILIYAVIYPIFDGIFLSIIYIAGGSSGGTDIISFWYSKKYGKPTGSILTYFNVATLIIGIVLGSFAPAGMINPRYWDAQYFFSPNMVASILASIVLGIVFNIYFPKHKSLKIQVYSKNTSAIIENLRANDFNNSITLNSLSDSLSLRTNYSLEIISPYIELPSLIHLVRDIDKDCLIVIYPIIDIDGEMVVRKSTIS